MIGFHVPCDEAKTSDEVFWKILYLAEATPTLLDVVSHSVAVNMPGRLGGSWEGGSIFYDCV